MNESFIRDFFGMRPRREELTEVALLTAILAELKALNEHLESIRYSGTNQNGIAR